MKKEEEIIKTIIEEIEKHEKIIILRHVFPDGDAYGFQFGLKNIININWPTKEVKILGSANPRLKFIGENFDTATDEDFKNSLVIIGDTANKERIDEPRWHLGKKIIKIDHHPERESYGDIRLVRSDFCAASEILTDIIQSQNLKIDQATARIIFHGIVTDTNRFLLRFPKARTLNLAAFLLSTGFNLEDLYQSMYEKEPKDLQLTKYVYHHYKTTNNGVAYLFIKQKKLQKLGFSADFVAYENVIMLANIKGCPVWAFFCEEENGQIRVELRAKNLPVNEIAEKFGGGGHRTASGIRVANWKIAKQVVTALDSLIGDKNEKS